jgi:hypothetical protein
MSGTGSQDGLVRTRDAVERQLLAMNSGLYEVGLYRPASGDRQAEMLLRTWDQQTLFDSLSWLRWQNSRGRNICVRPAGGQSWHGIYFDASTLQETPGEPVRFHFHRHQDGVTVGFSSDEWQRLKELFAQAAAIPKLQKLYQELSLVYGEL